MSRRYIYFGSFASATWFSDLFGMPDGAYSIRKLTPLSTNCIRVRRSSDNAEQDIGFVSNTPNALLDTTSLLSFVGAGNGFITTWYDQSTNNRHKIQTGGSFQPQIVSSGSLIVDNTNPAISRGVNTGAWLYGAFTSPSGDILTTTYMVAKRLTGSGYSAIARLTPITNSATDRRNIGLSIESTTSYGVRYEGGNTLFTSGSGFTQSIFTSWRDTANTAFKSRRNSSNLSVASSSASQNLSILSDSAFTLFHTGGVSGYANTSGTNVDAVCQEVIWYLNDNSSQNLAIETNINDFYNVF